MRFDSTSVGGSVRGAGGGSILCLALTLALGLSACAPPGDNGGGSFGGSSGTSSGGSTGGGGNRAGSGGSSSGGSGGSTSGSGGSTGSGGASSGGSTGSGGSASGSGGTPGSGGSVSGSGGQSSGDAATVDTPGGSGGAAGDGGAGDTAAAITFTKIFTEILKPGCTGANNACHSIARETYYHFADQATAHRLLTTPPGTGMNVPARVQVLLNQVKPANPAMPMMVGMPPQSGSNLGTPPIKMPPLTPAQISTIETWAKSGAKND